MLKWGKHTKFNIIGQKKIPPNEAQVKPIQLFLANFYKIGHNSARIGQTFQYLDKATKVANSCLRFLSAIPSGHLCHHLHFNRARKDWFWLYVP